nr:S8 family serine peptidase [Metabacillus crassostreae]
MEKGNHNVKVAVVDSGIDFNHPDLAPNIIDKGKSFVPGITTTQDYLGHGTMVSGVIAANGNIQGVAPEVGLVPYKVFHTDAADSMWIIEAIVEAAKDDMDVINLSLGTYKSIKNKEDHAVIEAYRRAAKYATKEGSIIIASSGTDGYDMSKPKDLAKQLGEPGDAQIHLPGGGLSEVVTVSATNNVDQLAYYSNFGRQVNIAAPAGDYGENYETTGQMQLAAMTITTYPLNIPQSELSKYVGFEHGYEFMTGTSLAAPKVSAVAALIIAEYQEKYNKKPTVKQIKKYLYKGASRVAAPKREVGVGIVNAHESLKAIKGGKIK